MREVDVRKAVHAKVLRAHRGDPDTLVIDELGLCQGDARVDIAVVNGFLAGFEIKSQQDTLERLPHQVEVYGRVLDRVTLVSAERHLDHAMHVIPDWWGVKVAKMGPRGAVALRTQRRPRLNPALISSEILQLLWREEAIALLEELGRARGLRSKPRAVLYDHLDDLLSLDQVRDHVRAALKARQGWRSESSP